MNNTVFASPCLCAVPLVCVWSATGNPAQPLECRWIPRLLAQSGAA